MENNYLITDIGSTTTKAILLTQSGGKWQLAGLANSPTTVEKPHEDVMAGVLNAISKLQAETGFTLLETDKSTGLDKVKSDQAWLSTSSAGGGLQILVIGLVKEESASSAERAAYGVGGVLLDTIAIDDGRSVVQQMHAIEDKQPDIILMSGGYEGGAYASVLRQAEILSYCEIKPKYSLHTKIPLVYAGNADAAQAIENILMESFEVHLLANIRPSEEIETTEHVSGLVHELFLNNVMQQAPGYKAVSEAVSDPVIPTPLGVMQALKLIAETEHKNILAVDIGGATTDVYSNIFGKFYRTVSANFGMSYNLCNVFAKGDREQLKQWLHPALDENVLRNYLGNKMLKPTTLPSDDRDLHIEQALARLALQLSLQQHLQMNFSIGQIGHFLKLKNDDLDPFHEQFFREKLDERAEFKLQDFHMLIGAGGVISHAPAPKQAALMLVDGLQPRGVTELWRDKHFITPHLGKLCQVNPQAALELLKKDCLEPLCLCIRPLPYKIKKDKIALSLELESAQGIQTIKVEGNKLLWIDNSKKIKIKVQSLGGVQLAYEQKELSAETDLPVLVDTRISGQFDYEDINTALQLYSISFAQDEPTGGKVSHNGGNGIHRDTTKRIFALPYAGNIYVSQDDEVNPDTLLGENLYDPPRLYVLQVFRGRENSFNPDLFKQYLQVKLGDEVKNGQVIYKEQLSFVESLLSASHFNFHSPVRGKVEKIDWQNGTLLLREIQDYSFEPVTINVAAQLGMRPSLMMGSLHKRKGEFVTTGEILAVKDWKKHENRLHSPATGTVIDVDKVKGTITIQYLRKNLKLESCLKARVSAVSRNRYVELEYSGLTINGCIGFGKTADGPVVWNDKFIEADLKQDFIAVFPFALNREQLDIIKRNRLSGIIVPSLEESDLVHILGEELGVGITGGEPIPFSIILTEGFGNLSYSREMAQALQDSTGRHGVLFPDTQIRAGVVRPSLVIQ